MKQKFDKLKNNEKVKRWCTLFSLNQHIGSIKIHSYGMGFNLTIKVIVENSNIHGELILKKTKVISCD